MKVVAIVGSRGYQRLTDVDELVASLSLDVKVISGGARGVDRRAAYAAEKHGIKVEEREPDPEIVLRQGFRDAALTRNREIVEAATIVHAFWDGNSTGTSNVIAHAVVLGKPLFVHTIDGTRFVEGRKDEDTETTPTRKIWNELRRNMQHFLDTIDNDDLPKIVHMGIVIGDKETGETLRYYPCRMVRNTNNVASATKE